MISRIRRINAFVRLGRFIGDAANEETIAEWVAGAKSRNNWFTPANVRLSLNAISEQYLNEEKLTAWAESYPEPAHSRKIGVVMAGNIPAVGFHDALCVLISGHTLLAKPSSDDPLLIRALLTQLTEIEPEFKEYIQFVERLNDSDAYIATGSDNTARYFHYYFAKKPNIIRRNRTSVAALTGTETHEELRALGNDILQYFGLGCRNVSKIFVPAGYDFTGFYESVEEMSPDYLNHHKYFNNYEYNKSIYLVNRVAHSDNGFLLATESEALVSPISVLHYQHYESVEQLKALLGDSAEKIQCIVAKPEMHIAGALPLGGAQVPGLSDYADGIDTMEFLSNIA
ncbi:acyl-CoA reductase [Dyadobacter beijingensis]|uniref:Acyl-CoA reductase n=1 Tax=Dyadobacter beijingensis TaxID=365489 RepID=A0ABQ2HV20_9BACT|nr:acyl-CoA reductase [Dyadobacter beijingensis]GGM89046.1 acyl-CoA reductase [Dyadobacter beijingensis]